MIPILYEKTEKEMKNWGLGQIADCQKAVVTEELNGDFTAEMVIPYTSPVYPLLMVDRIVGLHVPRRAVNQVWEGGKQPFRIVSISKPMAGLVTVKLEHVSAQLKKVIMKRWEYTSQTGIKNAPHVGSLDDFVFAMNITGYSGLPPIKTPRTCREYLQGKEGSLTDKYHCDWIFGGYLLGYWRVTAVDRRGVDSGLRIRYGYNMRDLKQDESVANVWTGLFVYWKKEVDGVEQYVEASDAAYSQYAGYYAFERIQSMDVSNEFETQPTAAQLLTWAQNYVDRNNYGVPAVSITINYGSAAKSEGYVVPIADGTRDQELYLGDTVHIDYAALGIDLAARVQKYTYDSIHEKYLTVDVGTVKPSITKSLAAVFRETGVKIR